MEKKEFDNCNGDDKNTDCTQNNDNLNDESSNLSDITEPEKEGDQPEKEKGKMGFFGKKSTPKKDKAEEEYKLLKEENEKLLLEKSELNDRFLRLYSEFDNYKKRTLKERLELIETASEKTMQDILPVVDDFERAIKANESVNDAEVIKEGFTLIYTKLLQVLKKNNIEEIISIGELFDTDFHEAITHIPTQDEEQKGKVIDVTQKGYKIKDKVIRYAKVVVGN